MVQRVGQSEATDQLSRIESVRVFNEKVCGRVYDV